MMNVQNQIEKEINAVAKNRYTKIRLVNYMCMLFPQMRCKR